MKHAILRILCGAVLLSLVSGIVVSVVGLVLGWETSAQLSDGIFWAGVINISIGFVSLQGYGQRFTGWTSVHLDPAERAKLWAADTRRGEKLMAFFGVSGLLLFGLSFLVLRLPSPQRAMNVLFQLLASIGFT